MGSGGKYHFYKCLNGLVDVAVPIVINGEHIANLFSGQFFFEEPDRKFFRDQAAKNGFNEEKYLEALTKVPVVTKDKVLIAMDFLLNMTQLISEMTFQKLEQIELNNTIKESEEKFKSVFESANVGKSITLPTGEIYVNKTFCSMLGYTREELQNKKWQDITPEDEISALQKKLDLILDGKKDSVRLEKRYICKNGNHIWSDVSVSIRRDENKNPLYFITTVIDITERKEAERAQRESEEKYRLISDNSDDWIYWILPDGQIHYVSPACERITGYSPEAFIENRELNEQIVFDADKKIVNQHSQTLIQESSPHELEYRIITKNGEMRWVSHSCSPIFGSKGEYMGRRATNRNITERKLVEEQLQQSEHRFSRMFNLGPVAKSLAKISEMVIIDFNKAAELMFDIKREDVVGKLVDDLDFWAVQEERLGVVELLRKQGFVHGFEFQYKNATGKTGWASGYSETIEIKGEKYAYNEYIDITERKRTEEVLLENNSRLDLAMQSAKMAWWEMDMPTGHVIFSKRKAEMLGFPPEKFSHYTDFMALVHPDDYDATMEAMRNHLNGMLPRYEIEYRILTNFDGYKWFFDIGTTIKRDSKGVPLKISGLVLDIDDRKKAEEKIREKDILFRKLSANVPDLIYQFTRKPDGSYFVPIASEGIKNIFGCTPEEVIDGFAPISRVIYHEDTDRVIRDIEYSAEHLTYFTCEFRVQIPGREIQWIYSKSTPEKLPDGSVTWYGFNVDITQKKQAEEALAESEDRFHKAFMEAPMGIAMAGFENKRFMDVNLALCEMLGFTEEEMMLLTFEDITHPDDRAIDIEAVKEVFEGRVTKHVAEKRYLKKNGEIIWGIRALTKISNTGDKPDYALALIKDITDRKNAEEELSRLNADLELRVKMRTSELEAVNKELETFTYSVSHDLKAPLRGIDGYSKLLSDIYKANLNEEARRFIDTIRNSTLQMNHLIDDLLDYSRLERSHLSIGRIKIKDLIQSLLSIYNAEIESRSIQVNAEISDIEIIADLKGLTIAIRNLIENAIKFTKGNVNPFIQIKLEEHNLSWIISIRDNGIGFDMQYHKKIFEIFQRLQRVEDFPGTGIGLAMVTKAMQRMNGKVWAESAPGMGSTFYLEVIKKP